MKTVRDTQDCAPSQELKRWLDTTMGKVIARRRQLGMSQAALGALLGLSQHQIAAIERDPAGLKAPRLYELMRVLGMSVLVLPDDGLRRAHMDRREDIFVFGSNTEGRHGKGDAAMAKQYYGAVYGRAEGLQGQSYAIPYLDGDMFVLPLPEIAQAVKRFQLYALLHQEMLFHVQPIACGIAGYEPEQIAPLFQRCPNNCLLPPLFKNHYHASQGDAFAHS